MSATELGPVTDLERLSDGQYDDKIAIMVGHNSNEGLYFSSPFIQNDYAYDDYIFDMFPKISLSAFTTITDVLYPNDLSGTQGYTNQLGRVAVTLADSMIVCNAYSLNKAAESAGAVSFGYEFSVPPSLHASDLSYTFFNQDKPKSSVNTTLATLMQRYFASFAMTGSPNVPSNSLPEFSTYKNLIVQNFNITMFGPMKDDVSVERCNWWAMDASCNHQ
jgi:cholinesterase